MNVCRFNHNDAIRIGLVSNASELIDLTPTGITSLTPLLEDDTAVPTLSGVVTENLPRISMSVVQLLAPVERQEIWAAGVTYLRSKTARMEESDFSAAAYDKVYSAPRPEIFFKALAEKVVGPGEPVGIRKDAGWTVPEAELVLMINSRGKIAGHTIGNDMSSRDIEGENLLYLPQAKIYNRSCALGPWIRLGAPETTARQWDIRIAIHRTGAMVFSGDTSVDRIKRSFEELAGYLFRSQDFPNGAALFTGTGIVPPDTFTLQAGDDIAITVSGIGELRNPVVMV